MSDDTRSVERDVTFPDELAVEWVPREAIQPNDYNPSSSSGMNREVLKKSIIDNAWTQPILVQPDGTIINGESRWFVARHPDIREDEKLTPEGIDAGYIPVHVRAFDDKEAMAATYQHNAAVGTHDTDAIAELVRETDDINWALDRLEMDESALEVIEETGEDLSDVEFTDDTDEGNYTETVEFIVDNEDTLTEMCDGVDAGSLIKLARFIIETGIHADVDAPDPDWNDVPEDW